MEPKTKDAEILGYCRVSTQEQREQGHSLEAQEKKIMDYAAYKGLTVKKVYKDEGISGADLQNRPALLELLKDIQPKQYLVVISLSRLARNAKQATEIEEQISAKKAYLVALDFDINTKTAVGKLIFQVMNSFNEFERNQTSERVSMTLRYMSSHGKLRSKPPFGKRFVAKDQPYIPDEYEQSILDVMRKLKKENPNITYTGMAEYLDTEGYKCRKAKKWYPNRVKKIMEENNIK
jgi:site-specific DNA recombinase